MNSIVPTEPPSNEIKNIHRVYPDQMSFNDSNNDYEEEFNKKLTIGLCVILPTICVTIFILKFASVI